MTTTTFNSLIAQVQGEKANEIAHSVRIRSGKYSVGIVRSEHNGKRISFSAALVERLGLHDEVFITSYPSAGFLILGSTAYRSESAKFSLRDNKGSGKICYSATLVECLIDSFHLDYESRVSKTFTEIAFSDGITPPMAVLKLSSPVCENTSHSESPVEDGVCPDGEIDAEDYSDNA